MGLLDWFRRVTPREDPRLTAWRARWRQAVEAGDATVHDGLARELDELGLSDDDAEIEREMLDALDRLAEVRAGVDTAGLPVVETGHRAVGTDLCHFTSPVSMPDEPSQPSGRLLLTNVRAIFVGGANGTAVPWHAVGEITQVERDLVLVRTDRQRLYRFRCNSFGDAVAAAFLARRLAAARRRSASGL